MDAEKKQLPCVTCGKVCVSLTEVKQHLKTHLPKDPQNCPICGTSCRNGPTLQEHVQMHGWVVREGHQCEHCSKNFKTNEYLEFHIRTVHDGDGRTKNRKGNHVCSFCRTEFISPGELDIHLRTHTGKVFPVSTKLKRHLETHLLDDPQECPICGESCRNGLVLKEHVQRHGNYIGNYNCEHCLKNFKDKSILQAHIRTVHGVDGRTLRTHTGGTPYQCDKCGEGFGDPTILKRHRLAIHPEDQRKEIPTHTQVGDQDPLHIPSENNQVLENNCSAKLDLQVGPTDVNPESQESETAVAFHSPGMGAGSEARPFRCPQCPKAYRHKRDLNDHIQVHSLDSPHVCPLCDKVWANSYKLTVHIRSHTGEKLFKCSVDGCGKEFMRRHTLESHTRLHTGENKEPKPTCAICGTIFANTVGLRAHNWKFHNPQKKQHPCVTCGKVFILSWDLRRHMHTHLPNHPQNCGNSYQNRFKLKEYVGKHGRVFREGRYPCEHCAKNFKTKEYLKLHIRTHTGEKPFKCTTCAKAFKTKVTLRAHCKVHTGEKPEECPFCGQRFAWKTTLNRHIRSHTGETPYKCDKCGKVLGDPTILKRHKLTIHPEDPREEDGQALTHTQVDGQDPLHIPSENNQGLDNNCSVESGLQAGPADAIPESQEIETPVALHPSEARPFPCPHCPKTYRLQRSLRNHMKVHLPDSPHVCPLCDKVCPDSSKLTTHMRSHTGEKLFRCSADGCGKEFMQRITLESHMQSQHGEKMESKPTCDICDKSFTTTEGLRIHNRNYHNPQTKQYPCVNCGKVCVTSTALKRHLKTHLPDDPQGCPICGKSCRNGLALKEHVKKHGRQGTYNCEHCLNNFTTKSRLTAHIRTVHEGQKDTRDKNHACSFCGWKFRTAQALTVHLRTHTGERPFKCTTCSKGFTTRRALESHSKLHTGENLEECQFCGRKFTSAHRLTQHLGTHTGENPYKCDECGKAFKWSSSLENHMRVAHSGEQQKVASTHAHTDGVVPMDPLTDTTSNRNTQKNDPLAEVVELYLDKGVDLHKLSVPILRIRLKDVGGGVLEVRSGGERWYVCSKCGRGSKSTLIRSHALRCQVHQSHTTINDTGQTIL